MNATNSNRELISATRMEKEALVVTIDGEIDLHNSPDLRVALIELLQKHEPKRLVLNLQKVAYMDSSAIAVLVELLQKMRKVGGRIALVHLQHRVRGLLEIARLDTIFQVAETEEAALK